MSFINKIFGKKTESTKAVASTVNRQEQMPKFNVKLPDQLTKDTIQLGSKVTDIKLEQPKQKESAFLDALFGGVHKEAWDEPERSSKIKFSDDFNPLAKLKLNPSQVLGDGTKIRMQQNEEGLFFEIIGPVKDELLEELYYLEHGNQELGGIKNIIKTEVVGNSLKVKDINAHYINTIGEQVGKTWGIRSLGAGGVAALLESVLKKVR